VTDLDEAVATESAGTDSTDAELIATHYLTSVDEVVDHLRAASQLGLGVRVRTYLEAEEDGQTYAERWEFELLTTSPVDASEA
jgi:hypothetical protein